MTPLDFA